MNRWVENKTKLILSIILVLSILGGCTIKSKHTDSIYADINIDDRTELFEENNIRSNSNFQTYYFPLYIPEKGEIGDITVFDDKIYYIVLFIKDMSNIAERTRIYAYDTSTEETTLVHEIKETEVFWVNELRANNDKLFWTTLKENKFTLESFDLKTKKVTKIHSVTNNSIFQPIVLGGNNKYFAWYEYDNIDNTPSLVHYNLTQNIISYINEENIFFDAFNRPSVNQEKALILKETDDMISFNLVDFKGNEAEKKFNLSKELGCIFPRISDDYIIWQNAYRENKIYIYNIKLKEIYTINLNELQINIFSIHLYNNIIYINTSKNIFYLDLDKKKFGLLSDNNFLKESFIEWNYTSSKISLDGQHISLLSVYNKGYLDYYACILKYYKE